MPFVVTLLYAVCCLLLVGMAGFVMSRNVRSWQHQCFALTALSLLAWLGTQFFFNRATEPDVLLYLGRANFATILFTSLLALLLIRAIAGLPRMRLLPFLVAETVLFALVTGFTSLVDQQELPRVGMGPHLTIYGPLFTLYMVHVLVYLSITVVTAINPTLRVPSSRVSQQLRIVGYGILATTAVSLGTNVLLPYLFSNFRFIDVGPLSTVLFLAAVAYAIVWHHLFDVRVLVRKTLVYGLLLTLVLAAYSSIVLLVTDRLAQENAGTLTKFGVLIIAFSFDPVKRFLDNRIDRLLFMTNHKNRREVR